MALYEYKGVDALGRSVKGSIEADGSKSARGKLKQKGVFITEISEKRSRGKNAPQSQSTSSRFRGSGVKLRSLTLMNRQLATLVRAHIPLDDALGALIDQTEDAKLKSVLSQVKEGVNQGDSLAKSFMNFPQVFPPMYTSMISVGEASGNLDLVLSRLASFSENQFTLRNKVVGSLAYPIFMALVGLGITIFLFAFAVPKITEVFASSKMALPALTMVMIKISEFMSQHWITVVVSLIGTFFLFKWYTSTTKGRENWDRFSLNMPVFGKLKRMIAVSRFARTMATLTGSGVQLLDAIEIVKDVVDNSVIRRALVKSKESIREGKTIAGPLRESGEFPPILTHMIAVGEKTGELEDMLNVVADAYDAQVETSLESMTRLLEPIMILVMGGMIAIVALSIFLPMLQLNNLSSLPG